MTQVLASGSVAEPRPGGVLRRCVLLTVTALSWVLALMVLDAVISPAVDAPTDVAHGVSLGLLAATLVAAPVLALALPALRSARSARRALLESSVRDQVRALETLPAPGVMLRRLVLSGYSFAALPLLLCIAAALVFGIALGEPAAGLTFALLALVPALVALGASLIPRLFAGDTRAGLKEGQVLSVRVRSRVDEKRRFGESYRSWLHLAGPGGQRILVRTPMHFAWAPDVRQAMHASTLDLVIGQRGLSGLLLIDGQPEHAIWLLGPVPLVRAPRWVLKELIGAPASS